MKLETRVLVVQHFSNPSCSCLVAAVVRGTRGVEYVAIGASCSDVVEELRSSGILGEVKYFSSEVCVEELRALGLREAENLHPKVVEVLSSISQYLRRIALLCLELKLKSSACTTPYSG